MSRIGKYPIDVPEKVDIKIEDETIVVKGPIGTIERKFNKYVKVELKDRKIVVEPRGNDSKSRAMWGTTRSIINNLVQGVSVGFTKKLEFNGVGYKAAVKGNVLNLNLGYSHPIDYKIPKEANIKVNKNVIEITSCDKELVGFIAAKIRSFRKPEPYKGKGMKYIDERIIRKAGKSAAKK